MENKNIVERFFILIIRIIVLVIVLVFWSLFGFVFWIPLLTRTIALFSFNLVYTMLMANPKEYTERLKTGLYIAIEFYIEGFNRIFNVMFPGGGENSTTEQVKTKLFENFKWARFIGELIWTLIFWGTVIGSIILTHM